MEWEQPVVLDGGQSWLPLKGTLGHWSLWRVLLWIPSSLTELSSHPEDSEPLPTTLWEIQQEQDLWPPQQGGRMKVGRPLSWPQ